MKAIYLITLIATLSTSAFAADDGEALFKKNGCVACHAVAKKMVGPAYADVAAKYKGDKDAQSKLESKVRNGGVGVWSALAMPPQKTPTDDDIKALVKWILSQK
jgi:cytochrome c